MVLTALYVGRLRRHYVYIKPLLDGFYNILYIFDSFISVKGISLMLSIQIKGHSLRHDQACYMLCRAVRYAFCKLVTWRILLIVCRVGQNRS